MRLLIFYARDGEKLTEFHDAGGCGTGSRNGGTRTATWHTATASLSTSRTTSACVPPESITFFCRYSHPSSQFNKLPQGPQSSTSKSDPAYVAASIATTALSFRNLIAKGLLEPESAGKSGGELCMESYKWCVSSSRAHSSPLRKFTRAFPPGPSTPAAFRRLLPTTPSKFPSCPRRANMSLSFAEGGSGVFRSRWEGPRSASKGSGSASASF